MDSGYLVGLWIERLRRRAVDLGDDRLNELIRDLEQSWLTHLDADGEERRRWPQKPPE